MLTSNNCDIGESASEGVIIQLPWMNTDNTSTLGRSDLQCEEPVNVDHL